MIVETPSDTPRCFPAAAPATYTLACVDWVSRRATKWPRSGMRFQPFCIVYPCAPLPPLLTLPIHLPTYLSRAEVRTAVRLHPPRCTGRLPGPGAILPGAGGRRTAADAVSWNAVDSREQKNERRSEKLTDADPS